MDGGAICLVFRHMLLALLFATAIAVSPPGTTPQIQPAVDVDDRQAVVVWNEEQQIRLTRIRFDGRRVDDGLVVGPGSAPRIAFDGVNHLIIWIRDAGVAGRFFAPNGD